jgi:rhodanese-related sulfurtransferase
MNVQVPEIDLTELPPDAALLDVREDDEWDDAHIAGAMHIPMRSLPNRLHYEPDTLDRELPVVVVCHSGNRSAHVTAWLVQQGYDAYNLSGGMLAWAAAGRPMVLAGDRPSSVT